MKKIIIALSLLLAIGITMGAVCAEAGLIEFNNGELTIQGLKFTIPDGFQENETTQMVGEEANQTTFPGFSISVDRFDKGNEFVVIKVVYGDKTLDNDTYTPSPDAESKQIGGHDGYFTQYQNGVSFDYLQDGKLVEIVASSEDILTSVLK